MNILDKFNISFVFASIVNPFRFELGCSILLSLVNKDSIFNTVANDQRSYLHNAIYLHN